jgi:release factor glutamine methyltransferase
VANLPYVADSDRAGLPVEVAGWEPPGALFAGPAGTEAIEATVEDAPRCLAPGGLLALEVGRGQDAEARRRIDATPGLEFLAGWRDLAGVERGVLALADAREA